MPHCIKRSDGLFTHTGRQIKSHLSLHYYQDLLYAFKTADYVSFKALLTTVPPKISNEMKKSVKTLKKHIANTFQSPYSNGSLEGTITKIKALNRIAFGYRSFSSFKRRILLACRTTQKAV